MSKIQHLVALFTSFFILTIACIIDTSAYMNTSASHISEETFFSALKAECEKYDIGFEIVKEGDEDSLTQEMLDDCINQLAYYAKSIEAIDLDTAYDVYVDNGDSETASISPAAYMPYEKTFKKTQRLYCPASTAAYADICLSVTAVVNADTNDLMSIKSYKTKQEGYFVNFVSWTQDSMKVTPNYAKDTISATATGTMVCQYTIPNANYVVGYSSEHTITANFSVK